MQLEVKNDFLHGNLEEEVFMEPLHGVTNGIDASYICRLKKALMGQSSLLGPSLIDSQEQ